MQIRYPDIFRHLAVSCMDLDMEMLVILALAELSQQVLGCHY